MGYSNGSIRVSGSRSRARSQFAANSCLCRLAHSSTSRSARAGKSPRTCPDSISNRDLVLTVNRVEVRDPMFVEEHADHDAKKASDFRHVEPGSGFGGASPVTVARWDAVEARNS